MRSDPPTADHRASILARIRLGWRLILAFSIPRQIHQHGVRQLGRYVARLRSAYRRGRRSRDLLEVRYEEHWARPVTELAETLCAGA
ncbi:MAG: hypothetical protein M3Y87_36255 [Myxococcota bacterium]|nr:hypothetical protein [Myxococcota bacterium]